MNNVPAVIVNIQRQPGANIIQVVDRIKTLLPQLHSDAALVDSGLSPDGSHHHHSRVGRGRAVRADVDRGARGAW